MAADMATFLRTLGPDFAGKESIILDATGALDLEELLELVDSREDLRDLDKEEVGMKALHVKKLFRAILQEKERRGLPSTSLAQAETKPVELKPAPPQVFPKLEKVMSTVPEDSVKEPSCYVACSDASKHSELPSSAELEAIEESATADADKGSKKVPMPDPIPRGPLLNFSKASSPETAPAKPKKFRAMTKDFPALGPSGDVPEVTRKAFESGEGAAAAARAFQAAELARLAAEQAERAAAEASGSGTAVAANAALARQMMRDRRGAYFLRKEAFDRVVEFFWEPFTHQFINGKAQYGAASPISALAEEDFQSALVDALKAFCDANQPDGGLPWATPEIEEWIAFAPSPPKTRKGKEMKPYALVMFKSLEDVQYIEHIYQLRMQSEDPRKIPLVKISGQTLNVQRPNPDFVQRADSSKGSETASQAGSVAGSENSHSSTSPSEQRNLTLLLMNLPEAVYASLSQRPAAKRAIEEYAARVLAGPPALPIAKDSIKFAASFSEPKKAPYCGCWLTFRYTVEKKRINRADGKACTFEELKALYKGKKDDVAILKLWERSADATYELERRLGGDGNRPTSIARWFMERVQEKKVPPPHGFESSNLTWTGCQVGGNVLSVQFKRPG